MATVLIVFNIFFLPEINTDTTKQEEEIKNTSEYIESDFTIYNNNTKKDDALVTQELISNYGLFANSAVGKEEFEILENEKLKLFFSNKGGRITSVILKEYETYDSLPLSLFNIDSSNFNLQFSTGNNINTKDLYFESSKDQNTISMKLKIDNNHYVEYFYKLENDYIVTFHINFVGMQSILTQNYMTMEWQMKTPQTEKSKENQDMYTGIYYQYSTDKEVDNLSLTSSDEEKIKYNLNWIAFKQQFFSSIFIAKNGFEKDITLKSNMDEGSNFIKDLYAKFELEYSQKKSEKFEFEFYFGPNNFKKLKKYNASFEEIIPLGWGIFGWVNKYVIINIFDFLSKYISNYGLIILLLTIIIKLALAPFTYKAFLSQAKMKVLKPEIDKINSKFKGKDPMKIQQETMAVYRKAGVNPMGGCLPMLFQFPILIAMFRFFPASIELRQQSFLWADDLSAYDSIMSLPFHIPFYGDHVSLFTLLMTISTLLYTKMNASMATGQMAQMKWMMYLMPIMFLGFFNNYAAALSYYYFLANMFTFSQQYFMKRLVNEKDILTQIEKNKKNPKKKSKFQKKLEELQKKQQEQMRKRK